MRANILWGAAVAAAMAACGPQQVGTRYVAKADVSASQGGALTVSNAMSPELGGTTLTIPAGAVDHDVTITLEIGDDVLPTSTLAGTAALFEPSGLVFKKPARLTLPIHSGLDTSHLFIQGQEDDLSKFQVPHSAVTVSGNTASFDVLGFTTFQPGLGQACSVDSDCSGGQICQAGACVELIVCSSDAQCPSGDYCLNGACAPATDGGQPDAGHVCTADCATGYTCVDGQCVPIDTGDGGVCVTTADCPGGWVCVNGQCMEPLDGGQPDGGLDDGGLDGGQPDGGLDGGQPDGGLDDGGQDGGPSDAGSSCSFDSDCAVNQVCVANQCVDALDGGQADAGLCITAQDCGAGQVCVNGVCTP